MKNLRCYFIDFVLFSKNTTGGTEPVVTSFRVPYPYEDWQQGIDETRVGIKRFKKLGAPIIMCTIVAICYEYLMDDNGFSTDVGNKMIARTSYDF